jgi:hypothetical protein
MVAIEGLSDAGRQRLREAIEETDLVLASAAGRVVLGGSVADLQRLADEVSEPDGLAAALDKLWAIGQ